MYVLSYAEWTILKCLVVIVLCEEENFGLLAKIGMKHSL